MQNGVEMVPAGGGCTTSLAFVSLGLEPKTCQGETNANHVRSIVDAADALSPARLTPVLDDFSRLESNRVTRIPAAESLFLRAAGAASVESSQKLFGRKVIGWWCGGAIGQNAQ